MTDEMDEPEVEIPLTEAAGLPDDPDDEDDPPIEPIPEDDGTPEDDVPQAIADDPDPEDDDNQPGTLPAGV
jgi:hypothetical protein